MRRTYLCLAALFCLLAVLGAAFVRSTSWTRIAWGVAGYSGLLAIYALSRLQPRDIGLTKRHARAGLKLGLETMGIILLSLTVIFIFNSAGFKDPRHHQSIVAALVVALFQVPLLTVLFEELVFRGIVPGLLYRVRSTPWFAAVWSSVAFGLWHIPSATTIGDYRVTPGFAIPNLYTIFATVAFTTVAGLVLCGLRLRSKSLVAPMLAHWALNAFALLLAALSWH